MQSASIVLALCLLAKASADSSYGSSYGDMSEACQAAQAAVETANGDLVYTCLDANGDEIDGTCDMSTFDLPEETTAIQATGKCMSVNIDLTELFAEGDDDSAYEPEVTAGSDQCGTACTTAISTMETSGCVSADDSANVELMKINAACDSATMAGAALALIAVALF